MMAAFIVALAGAFALGGVLRSLSRKERQIAYISYVAHLVMSLAQVAITKFYYGGGDSMSYYLHGQMFSRYLRASWTRFAPEVLALTFGSTEVRLPGASMAGSSTGCMQGISTWLVFGLGDDSFVAMNLVCAVASTCGAVLLYRSIRPTIPATLQTKMCVYMLLVPSVLFWTSGLLKESLAFAGLGAAVFGLRAWTRGSYVPSVLSLLVGVIAMWLLKPFYVAVLLVAVVAWFVARRFGARFQVRHALGALTLSALGVLAVGAVFPALSIQNLTGEFLKYQQIGAVTEGGSNYTVFANATGFAEQVLFAPMAILTALFRPFLFEAHNAVAALSALESTVFLVVFVRLLARGPVVVFQGLIATPDRVFAFVFVVIMALGVGFTSTNLGTLTRYRVPLIPLFVYLLVLLNHDKLGRRGPLRE